MFHFMISTYHVCTITQCYLKVIGNTRIKNAGVRPIGIGETIRRIIGKAILANIGQNIIDAAGPLQLCVGQ